MADTLIGNPGITANLSEAVINMAPGFVEHPFFAIPWRLDKAIHAPIELPSGKKKDRRSTHKALHGAGSSQD